MSRSLAAVAIGLGLVLSATAGPARAQEAPPADACRYEGGSTDDEGNPLYNGEDSSRHTTLLRPFALAKYPCEQSTDLRAVRLGVGKLDFIEGGQLLDRLPVRISPDPLPFEEVADLMSAYSWAAEVEPGVFELSAAVIQAPGTSISVASPRVTTVRLLDRPGVFMGGRGATVRFDGVTVTSWDPQRSMPDANAKDHRPFVVYDESSRLDVARSHMSFLGSDRTSGYGVMWGRETTGEVVDSTFAHNFFGAYMSHARDVVFRGNVFRDNVYYGFDPHTDSHDILAEDNEAYGNGSHGFIGAGGVVDSVLRRNHAHDNRGNGIVLDRDSDRNVIEGNLVENNGRDGIALIASSDNVVRGNVVRNHRVGVRINKAGSDRNQVRANVIETSGSGIQVYGGATETIVADNSVVSTTGTALMLDATGSQVTGGHVYGAAKGIDIRAATRVAEVRFSQVDHGLVVGPRGKADVEQVHVRARVRAVIVQPGGSLQVAHSTLEPGPGRRPWMPLAGVAAVSLAVLLQALSHQRRRDPHAAPGPPGIWNTA